jgi:Fe-S-cluster containining protein
MMTDEKFVCLGCGNCCRPSGYVRLREGEVEAIAEFLGVGVDDFIQTQTRVTDDRQHLSLLENADGVCVFLTPDSRCRINDVKPEQCRGYPWRWRDEMLDPLCAGRRAMGARIFNPSCPR